MSSSFFDKAAQFSGSQQLRNAFGSSNTLVQMFDPFGAGMERLRKGGSYADALDPGNVLHPDDQAPITDTPVNQMNGDIAGNAARDRVRRIAYRAQGRASTIKVSPSAAPFTAQPKALLGS